MTPGIESHEAKYFLTGSGEGGHNRIALKLLTYVETAFEHTQQAAGKQVNGNLFEPELRQVHNKALPHDTTEA